MTVTSGYFPEVELLGGEWTLRHISLRRQRAGKVDSVTICCVLASIVRLAFIWAILPKMMDVDSKNDKAQYERNRSPRTPHKGDSLWVILMQSAYWGNHTL